jgi:chromosome segregation ATPase
LRAHELIVRRNAAFAAGTNQPAAIGTPRWSPIHSTQRVGADDQFEDELAKLSENPDGPDAEETGPSRSRLEQLQASLRNMEGQISKTSKRRKECDDRYSHLTARRNEITELHECFELLDAQYTNDNQTLVAIEESGSSL